MPQSKNEGDMVRMPLPNGGFAIYPLRFALDAQFNNIYSLFVSKGNTPQDASVMMATLPDGANVFLVGPFDKLIDTLLEIPWKEDRVKTSDGLSYRKIAPSLDALLKYIDLMKNTTL
jgi:hypothetical protein